MIGGETAEMPGMYAKGDYDLAGFCVGIVEKSNIVDGSSVRNGDMLIAIGSSGPHSNGYSLIRKVLEVSGADVNEDFFGRPLGEVLLEPTKLYVKSILALLREESVHSIAHITGGGLLENIPRVLPRASKAVIDTQSWDWPEIFSWLKDNGNIDEMEMYRTFNCGVGMVVAVAEERVEDSLNLLRSAGEQAWVIGHLTHKADGEDAVQFV